MPVLILQLIGTAELNQLGFKSNGALETTPELTPPHGSGAGDNYLIISRIKYKYGVGIGSGSGYGSGSSD